MEGQEDILRELNENFNPPITDKNELDHALDTEKKDEATLRTIAKLPNGNGKKIKVAVLCEEAKSGEAKNSGADLFGSENIWP